jgi:nucleoside-diphosphate-sugar epimerase
MSTVLVTGATGFVGGATVARLLEGDRVERVVVLARGSNRDHARERVERSVARFGPLPTVLDRLEVVLGDLAHPELSADLLNSVTHVIHAAAHTSFRSVRTAWATNVEGTRAFADAVGRAPRLERFLYIGTAYRCGAVEMRVVDEDVAPSSTHVAEYTRTKAEAEALLERQGGLPLLIARPSIVIGHTTLGVAPSASLYWYYWAQARAGVSLFADSRRRDIVPVDWLASAIIHLLFLRSPLFRCYHLSAGEGSAVSWSSIYETFRRHGQAAPTTQQVDFNNLANQTAWTRLELEERARLALMACAKFSALPVEMFSNRRLLSEGVQAPPPFTSYLPLCIRTNRRSLNELALDDA